MLERTARWMCLSVGIGLCGLARGDDWPQWMGPERDNIYREQGVLTAIPSAGLKTLWRTPIAGGYAGPSVAGDKVIVTDYVRTSGDGANNPNSRASLSGRERVLCLDASGGHVVWTHEYDCPYEISYPAGPRCVPVIDGDRVYSLGAQGDLYCLNAENGSVVWSRSLPRDYRAPVPLWGFSGHPLIEGDLLYCVAGGPDHVAMAFDKQTGEVKWHAVSASEAGYAPPTLIHASGRDQLLVWDADKLNSLKPETGEVYWSTALKPSYGMAIMAPRLSGDLLFASGIGNVAGLYQLDADSPGAKEKWHGDPKKGVYCANSTPFLREGMIYGADCRTGGLRGVDLKSSDILWETFAPTTGNHRAGHGTAFIVAQGQQGDNYYLFSETGDLISARLTRDGYEESGRCHILEPTGEAFGRAVVWSQPAFARHCCFARNDKEIVCVDLTDRPSE